MKARPLEYLRKAKVSDTVYADDEDGDEIGTIKSIKSSKFLNDVTIEYTNGETHSYPYNQKLLFLPDDDTIEEWENDD